MAYGRTTYAIATPSAKNSRASGIHGRTVRRSAGVRPGRDERPDLVEQDRHRQDDPDDDRDPELDREAVAGPEDLRLAVRQRARAGSSGHRSAK